MPVKVLLNGQLELQDENGGVSRIGPEHPDYRRYLQSVRIDPRKARVAGIGCILAGAGALWLNWHLLLTNGYYNLRLVFFGPLAFLGGILVLLLPAGVPRVVPSARSRMLVGNAFMLLIALAIGLNWYLLANHRP